MHPTACAADKTSLGAIVRLTPAEQQTAPDAKYSIKGTIQIGNYWYGYENSHAACTDGTAAMEAAISKAAPNFNMGTLQDTFRTLEEAPAQYLTIPEWGIKIKLADADKITYTLGGNPNGSSANADGIVSWATLKLNSSVSASDKCRLLGYEVEQMTAGTGVSKIGKYDYGISGVTPDPCGDSTVDSLRAKITGTELVNSAITAE